MITALVQIKLPQPMAKDKAKDVFAGTAPKYREVKGLIRKYYLLSEDGATAGGVYLWISREAAEQLEDRRDPGDLGQRLPLDQPGHADPQAQEHEPRQHHDHGQDAEDARVGQLTERAHVGSQHRRHRRC